MTMTINGRFGFGFRFSFRQAGRQIRFQIQIRVEVVVQMQVQFEVEWIHSYVDGKEVRKVFRVRIVQVFCLFV